MMLSRRSLWPVVVAAIVLAEFAVDLRYGVGWTAALGFAAANSVEPLIGASLVLAWCKGVPDLRRRNHLAYFVAGAAVLGPLVGGLIGGLVGRAARRAVVAVGGAALVGRRRHRCPGDRCADPVVAQTDLTFCVPARSETVIVLLATAGTVGAGVRHRACRRRCSCCR